MKKQLENNQITLMGQIISDLQFSHEVYGEGFYTADISVKRLSGSEDILPIMISERLIEVSGDYREMYVYVTGQLRSYNRQQEKKKRLILSVFITELGFLEGADDTCFKNQIFLDGYICKKPLYRKTTQGREIADVLVAVNRPYGKSDYIPCIIWGRNARYIENCPVGSHVQLWGRVQSREYTKRRNNNVDERYVAYEVSVSKMCFLEKAVM